MAEEEATEGQGTTNVEGGTSPPPQEGAAVAEGEGAPREEGPEVGDGPSRASGSVAPNDPAARISELEGRLASTQADLQFAQAEAASLREQVSSAQSDLRLSAAKYREAMLAAAPDVPPELVAGVTVAEVDRSLVAARETVAAVQRRLAERAAAERVPAGAPARGGTDLSALSPREKIALALSRG